MKPHAAVCCLLMMISRVEAGAPSLVFPTPKIELPSLSLLDKAGKSLVTDAVPANRGTDFIRLSDSRRGSPLGGATARRLAQMPIIVPRDDLDPKMAVTPDPTIDYALRIVRPPNSPVSR